MENEQTHEVAGKPLVTNATMDAIVAAVMLAIGIVVVYEAWQLGATWGSDGPGAGYFPFYIALIICIASIGNLFQALISKPRDNAVFVDSVQLKRVLQVLVPSAIYVAAIMVLGLYVASAIFIAVFMITLGNYSIVKSVVLGFVINALFFAMFEVWFKVPLYKGSLDPLAFLGY